MARPIKDGLDYFPHDTDASNDEKVEALRILYGNNGYAFYFIMLERIYRTPNFEIDISDAETRQILGRKIGINEEEFNQILLTALKWKCFDVSEYQNRGVLTSKGIKKRANVVVEKREKMREKYQNRVSASETTQETRVETPQSKVKKSKVNNKEINKEKEKVEQYTDNPDLQKAIYDYIEMRKEKKKAPTENALTLILKKADKLASTPKDKIEVFNQSTRNGWTDIYPVKVDEAKEEKPKCDICNGTGIIKIGKEPNVSFKKCKCREATPDKVQAITQNIFRSL